MNTKIKVGSKVEIPVYAGATVNSSDPSVVTVSITGNVATATAMKIGTVWIAIQLGTDLRIDLQVSVVA